ncbi:hypothetical protein BBI10_02005 [Pseudomonas graminis]|uniref:Uncharacterized protein n=1 Tax=Pseudomonas graminis TaxID=158627 RepID=A0A1C2EEZ1_9PSED|nr:hypothetical protein BBI10_02005 [Pseudomonas graminis]
MIWDLDPRCAGDLLLMLCSSLQRRLSVDDAATDCANLKIQLAVAANGGNSGRVVRFPPSY